MQIRDLSATKKAVKQIIFSELSTSSSALLRWSVSIMNLPSILLPSYHPSISLVLFRVSTFSHLCLAGSNHLGYNPITASRSPYCNVLRSTFFPRNQRKMCRHSVHKEQPMLSSPGQHTSLLYSASATPSAQCKNIRLEPQADSLINHLFTYALNSNFSHRRTLCCLIMCVRKCWQRIGGRGVWLILDKTIFTDKIHFF